MALQQLIELGAIALRECGCLFITSAIEAVDDRILDYLAKNHTNADFGRAVQLLRAAGIALAPTFVPFTPWTTLEGYITLLARLVELESTGGAPDDDGRVSQLHVLLVC